MPETTVGTSIVPSHYVAKEWTNSEKEKVALDSHLQLIIIDSMDLSIFGNIAVYGIAKEMWDHIEVLCEGTEEVRENKKQILLSQYEAFMAQPKEGITEVFERFYRLVNELLFNGKTYSTKELNMKFLLTVANHLEPKVKSLRERDLNKITYNVLYEV